MKKKFLNVKKAQKFIWILKINKLIFKMEWKDTSPVYLLHNFNYLLRIINVFAFFNMVDFFRFLLLCRKVWENRQLGAAYALGQSSFFKKYERKNLKFFIWSWENYFRNFWPSLIEKIGIPFFKKNRSHFQETKVVFCSKFFCIKIGKTEFSFLINGSDSSSKYRRIHFKWISR